MKENTSWSPTAQGYIRREIHLTEKTLMKLQIGTGSDLTLYISVTDLIQRVQLTFIFIIKLKYSPPKKNFEFFPLLWDVFTFI